MPTGFDSCFRAGQGTMETRLGSFQGAGEISLVYTELCPKPSHCQSLGAYIGGWVGMGIFEGALNCGAICPLQRLAPSSVPSIAPSFPETPWHLTTSQTPWTSVILSSHLGRFSKGLLKSPTAIAGLWLPTSCIFSVRSP